jgi:isoleucyl-tRNA synthetase
MKELQGETASHTDGEVIVVFDLRADSALLTKRTARELVNRFQKLRKKAGLLASDAVELFYAPRAPPVTTPRGGRSASCC